MVNGVSLSWSSSLEFIGNVFDLCGHSSKSAEHRQHKANGVFRRWAPILTNLSLPISERMNAFRVSVACSALWLPGCWTLTKTQSSKLGSWSARLLCRMVSCRRRPDESPVDHWRRWHRTGHALAEHFCLDLPQLCLLQKHRFAGRVARLKPDSLAHRTLTTRDLVGGATRRQHTKDLKTNGWVFTVNVSMSGGGKHLWNPSMVVRSGNRTPRPPVSVGFSLLKIEKSGKAMNVGFLVCNDVWVEHVSILSCLVSSSNFGRAHSVLFLLMPSRWSHRQFLDLGRGTVAGTSE